MSHFRRLRDQTLRFCNQLQRPELWMIAAVVIAATLVWGFAELADEVIEGETASIDEQVLLMLRTEDDLSDPLGPRWVEELGRDMTALGGVGVLTLLTISVSVFLWLVPMHRAAVYVVAAVVGAIALSLASKAFFSRPRPDLVPHGSHVYTTSFPSGHSMMAASVYLTLGILIARFARQRRLQVYCVTIAVLVTLAVGVSRVYMGVHWPTDVLAGWALGAAWALACWAAATWLQRRGVIEEKQFDVEEAGHGRKSTGGGDRSHANRAEVH